MNDAIDGREADKDIHQQLLPWNTQLLLRAFNGKQLHVCDTRSRERYVFYQARALDKVYAF